jgi:tetratricopeptide (TPR) repeat protein
MNRVRMIAAAVLATMPASMPVMAQTPHADPARQYAACMAVARSEPKRGLETALAWEKAGGGTGARHCRAIALFGLGSHVEAGQQLEALAREMTGQSAAMRAEVYAQAGQAYQAARLGEQALAVQNAAILLDSRNVEIWIDRSITYAGVGAYREAAADLTRALALAPGRVDVMIMRAAAWREVRDFKAALADAEAALRIDPNSPDALLERGLARVALGDRKGGEGDLRRTLSLVPQESDLATRARAALGVSGSRPPAAPSPAPAPRKPADKAR